MDVSLERGRERDVMGKVYLSPSLKTSVEMRALYRGGTIPS